jgi:glyoxylase-like metal-dependent hydrolase (beta-lactamase superfamily II)
MSLQIKEFCSSPLENNVILLFDDAGESILFDPSFGIEDVYEFIKNENLTVGKILFTHGHFDHFAGLAFLLSKISLAPQVGLHAADLEIWREGGGSRYFRMPMNPPCDPDLFLENGQQIALGESKIEVRHTPGHSPGSVTFYIPALQTALVGDLLFHRGIGRTDLEGGDFQTLKNSVQTQIFTLPADTVLIPGHGPHTTVKEEMENNPFIGLHANY